MKTNNWTTPARIRYWESLKGRKQEKSPNWKGDLIGKSQVHRWLDTMFGKPRTCVNPNCPKKSSTFDWCLITGKQYLRRRENFLRMCRSCHRRYDMTEEKKKQGIKNLLWMTGGSNSKQVAQYDMGGKLIKVWNNHITASKKLGVNYSSISNCLSGKYKTAGGYKWKHV